MASRSHALCAALEAITENRGRLLCALVTSVKVDEDSGTVEFHLVKLATVPEAKRLDGEPKEAP